jgi:Trypsin-co-occurring domain 1
VLTLQLTQARASLGLFAAPNGGVVPYVCGTVDVSRHCEGCVLGDRIPVAVNGVEFYVEVAEQDGVGTVGLDDVLSFDGVRDTVEAIAGQLAGVWDRVKPAEATVAFGLKLVAKSGKLTGLLVEGGGEASLTVTMTWRSVEAGGTTQAG